MIRYSKLGYVELMVTDLERSAAFYRDIVGLEPAGRGLARFKAKDVPVVYGPGRHLASTSVFLYFLDPDGMTLEYSFGMEEFPEVGARAPRIIEPTPLNFDTWGSYRDPRMSTVGDIA